jgi:hypothetical protein
VPSALVDTGPLVGLIDRRDQHHVSASKWLQRARRPLITNIAVLTEATHLLDFSVDAQLDLLDWISREVRVDNETEQDLPRIAAIMRKYEDRPADFADASLVALAERLNIDRIVSTDRDFGVYRTAKGKPLRNEFFDDR